MQSRDRLRSAGQSFAINAASRNLRRAQLSFATAWTSEWILTIALAVVAFQDGGTPAVGAVAFLRLLPAAVLSPVGTALADRFPRDSVLRWTCFGRALALGASAVTLQLGGPTAMVYALAAIATIAFVVFRPAHSALMPSLCSTPLELTSANVVRGLTDSLSTLVGPGLAALLLTIGDPALALATAAALTLASGLTLNGLSYQESAVDRAPTTSARRLVGEAVEGFRTLARFPDVFLLVRLTLTQAATRGCFNVLVVVLAIDVLGIGDAGVGVLTAAVGVGAVVGSLAASLFTTGRRLAVLFGIGVALWGLPLVVVGGVEREAVILAMLALVGVGNALVDVGIFTLPSRLVPDSVLARVFGALESLGALVVAAASLVAAGLVDVLGVRWAFVAVGVVGPVYVAAAWTRLRAIDRTVTHRDHEIGLLAALPMFRPLTMPAIERLADRLETHDVDADIVILTQGERGDRFYIIERGVARVDVDGVAASRLDEGDYFGEIALLRNVPRVATVVAVTPMRLRSLARDAFLATFAVPHAGRAAAEEVASLRLASNAQAGLDDPMPGDT